MMTIFEGLVQLITYRKVQEGEGGKQMREDMSYMHMCFCLHRV